MSAAALRPFLTLPLVLMRAVLALGALALAACQPVAVGGGGDGPRLDPGAAVPVAMLLPGTGGADAVLAQHLENAARLAIADLQGVQVDLRIYSTGEGAAEAAAAATRAADEGAQVILGPLYADAANAAGVAVAGRGISVLSFSNNAAIAGGNVFVLGNLFQNTADRLITYAARQGRRSVLVVHGNGGAETVGRDAAIRAVQRSGASLAGTVGFDLSQQAVTAAIPRIVAEAQAKGADTLFLTSGTDGALPLLAQLLPEQGLTPGAVQWVGLQRWDIPATATGLPGLQGGWFALPDPGLSARFGERYSAAYGAPPHPVAGLAYDGIAAIGALVKTGRPGALSPSGLTQSSGFVGVNGIFRLLPDGTNQRGLAVAQIQNSRVVVIDPAPRSFGGF